MKITRFHVAAACKPLSAELYIKHACESVSLHIVCTAVLQYAMFSVLCKLHSIASALIIIFYMSAYS